MLCEDKCDAGGPNQLADHYWKSWTLDSPWHPDKGYPFGNAPFGAFFRFSHPPAKNCDAKCDCMWYNLWEIKKMS